MNFYLLAAAFTFGIAVGAAIAVVYVWNVGRKHMKKLQPTTRMKHP